MAHPSSLEALGAFAEAVQDLVTAGLEIGLGRTFACADACNQAVEKALQAVYVARQGRRAPYDHDLAELGAGAGVPPDLMETLAMLSRFHPETFYAHTPPELAWATRSRPTRRRNAWHGPKPCCAGRVES